MERYNVIRVDNEADDIWDMVDSVEVGNFPWDETGYRPYTSAKVYYDNNGLHVKFYVEEKYLKIQYFKNREPVYKDSCVEFFLNPCPDSDSRYINIEINAAGVVLSAIGKDRKERIPLDDDDLEKLNIRTYISKEEKEKIHKWGVIYDIPFEVLTKYYGSFSTENHRIIGNFYKCGDLTPMPHFGCWNYIENPQPDFHRPEFFGEIVLI